MSHKFRPNAAHQGLLINPTHITAAKVHGSQVTLARVDLPAGVIQNGSLHDITIFRDKLQALLKQIQFPTPSISLSLPEHQAFVKRLEIDAVPLEDLHEAILYQLDNYLPFPLEKLQVDWCILEQQPEGRLQIQVVALPRVLVDDYIHVLQAAGLKIITIETPSQTLTRLVDDAPHPALIIEAEPTTHLVFSSRKYAVDFSAIIDAGNQEAAATQLNQYGSEMLAHYDQKYHQKIVKIFITGSQAPAYAKLLKLPVEVEVVTFIPNPPDQQCAYMVAEKSINPPTDPNTINLLPVHLMGGYHAISHSESLYDRFISLSFIFLIIFNVIAGGFLGYVWMQQLRLNDSNSQPAFASLTSATQIKQVNAQIDVALKVAPGRDHFPKITDQVLSLVPAGVQLSNITLDASTHTLSLSGNASEHLHILELKSKLEEQKNFTQIKIPLSIFEKQDNIPFTMTASWQVN